MTSSSKTLSCPICKKEVGPRPENKTFPFCSQRCKSEDLSNWLGGRYAVPGPPASPHDIAQEIIKDSE